MTTTDHDGPWLDGPLAGPDSPLDGRQRAVVLALAAAERRAAGALPTDDPLDPERRRRVEATGPELHAQPDALRATWHENTDVLDHLADALADQCRRGSLRRVLLAGAGDSLAVLDAAGTALQDALGVGCTALGSLEAALYPPPDLGPGDLVITLSSSGATPRTVEAALVAQAAGAATIAVTNTAGSALDRESATTLLVRATRVGWPTQSSTAALGLLLRLAAQVGVRRGTAGADAVLVALEHLPQQMAEVLAALDAPVRDVVAAGPLDRVVVFSAGGPDAGSAVMGAAKVRECTPGHAIAIGLEEFHHYNSLKAGEPLWLLAPRGRCLSRALDTAREARRWGGTLHVVTTVGESAFDTLADDVLEVPATPEALSPLLTVLPAQLVGYHLARAQFSAAQGPA